MNFAEALGWGWIIFTAALGHVAVIYWAYRHFEGLNAAARDQLKEHYRLASTAWHRERELVGEQEMIRRAVEGK